MFVHFITQLFQCHNVMCTFYNINIPICIMLFIHNVTQLFQCHNAVHTFYNTTIPIYIMLFELFITQLSQFNCTFTLFKVSKCTYNSIYITLHTKYIIIYSNSQNNWLYQIHKTIDYIKFTEQVTISNYRTID